MFGVHDRNSYLHIDTSTPKTTFNDFNESYASNQIKRVFHRPLFTKEFSNKNFSSWKGRCVCVVKFCHNLLREPFRFLKSAIVIMIISLKAFLHLLNAPFSNSERSVIDKSLVVLIDASAGIFIRPVGFFVDMLQLASGAILHPTLAIH
ncbi:MAG: hypothetical protein AAGG81_05135 [Chlamydiota bacterium]